jgi:mRNA interferase MazF
MPLSFHPRTGVVLMCDFNTGFKAPEMVKVRPVVVISPRRRSDSLCTVVPLSTTAPNPVEGYHHRLDPKSLPSKLANAETWAKCDMVTTVSLERLDRVKNGKEPNGKRIYVAQQILPADLEAIRRCVLVGLGISTQVLI